MLRFLVLSACIVIGASLLHSAEATAPVAAMHKPFGIVDCNINGTWKKAQPAMPLYSGNIVRTQENSFAIIKFLESSILRVQEKSEVEISGTKSTDREFSKNVHVRTGTVGFNVKHRPNEKFEFSTPTSVASIRGTEGALMTEPDSSDLLVLSSGTVVFTNSFSHRSVTVTSGQTGHSFTNGQITVVQSNPNETRRMHHVLLLGSSDTTGSNSGHTGSDSTGTHGAQGTTDTTRSNSGRTSSDTTGVHGTQGTIDSTSMQGTRAIEDTTAVQPGEEVRIKVTDPNGKQKTMIIKFE